MTGLTNNSKNMQKSSQALVEERERQKRLKLQDAMAVKVDGLVRMPLTRGLWAVVDEADYELVKAHKWHACKPKNKNIFYAKTTIKIKGEYKHIKLHRFILNATIGSMVDHIDGNGLNNQRSNLRFCNYSENQRNRSATKKSKTGFKGVFKSQSGQRFVSKLGINGKDIYLGTFDHKEQAAKAYDYMAKKLCGKFARLNFK